MAAKNPITGDSLTSRPASEAYRNNYDAIFNKGENMDECDIAQERIDAEMANRIREHQYQLGHAVSAADIESETCDGCSYITKSSYGHRCESWRDCRDDIERKAKFGKGK